MNCRLGLEPVGFGDLATLVSAAAVLAILVYAKRGWEPTGYVNHAFDGARGACGDYLALSL